MAAFLGVADQQRGQEAADAAVAVAERVGSFELHMGERRPDERRHSRVIDQKPFKLLHAFGDVIGRRRHEVRLAGSRANNSVLREPELPP